MDPSKFHVSIISHLRPKNVPEISKLLGNVHWYVGKDETKSYQAYGAEFVHEGGGLCASRNLALDHAFNDGKICVEFSDDFKGVGLGYIDKEGKKKKKPCDPYRAMHEVEKAMTEVEAKLGGVAPTSNPFYWNPERQIGEKHFIVGDFILVKETDLRFDEKMRLKEDYDYTLQHLEKYGIVARNNNVLATFLHRTNKGGAVAFRNKTAEQEAISYLKEKWPGMIKDNPRREDEILMRWKPVAD